MIIVAGSLTVDPAGRDRYLEEVRAVTVAARSAGGNVDFHQAADPIEPDRINVFEAWETVEAVEAFRGDGPTGDVASAIRDADVRQYEIASVTQL